MSDKRPGLRTDCGSLCSSKRRPRPESNRGVQWDEFIGKWRHRSKFVGTAAQWEFGHAVCKRMLTAMDDIPPRAVWIDRFVMHTRALGVRAEPELIEAMAAELWPTLGHLQPEVAAQAEYDEWRPHDY